MLVPYPIEVTINITESKEQIQARIAYSLTQRNRQHSAGTVAELAQRLGISKSEVRRLKASGELDSFLDKHDPSLTA